MYSFSSYLNDIAKPAAAWIEEGGALTFGDATFDQILLDAHKLHVAIKVTEELLYDNAFGLESYIIAQFGKALSNAEEDAFLNGTGTGQPLGLFAAKGGGTVADTVETLTADNVINLVYALKRPYRKNARFIMNDKTVAQIRTFKDNNGAYMWQPALTQGEPDRLLGYEVYTSPYARQMPLLLVITNIITLETVAHVLSSSSQSFLQATA